MLPAAMAGWAAAQPAHPAHTVLYRSESLSGIDLKWPLEA
eukprot:COSAG04_NODE_32038_length_253_cov_0.974026_1_plen_39_part_10